MGGLFSRKKTRDDDYASETRNLATVDVYSSFSGSYVFVNSSRYAPNRSYPTGSWSSTPSRPSTEGYSVGESKAKRYAADSIINTASNERYGDVESRPTSCKGCDSVAVKLKPNEGHVAPAVRNSTTSSVNHVIPKSHVSDKCRLTSINVSGNEGYSTGSWNAALSRSSVAANDVNRASSGAGKISGSVAADYNINSAFNKSSADANTVKLKSNEGYAAPAVRISTPCSVKTVIQKSHASDKCRSAPINVSSDGSYSTDSWSTAFSRSSVATNDVNRASSGVGKIKGSVADNAINSAFNKSSADGTIVNLKSGEVNVAPAVRSAAERSYADCSVKPVLSENYENDMCETAINVPGNGSKKALKKTRIIADYVADGGSRVVISVPLNPWQVLGLSSSRVSHADVNAAFKMKITQPVRQNRAMISTAYHMLTSSAGRYKRIHGTDKFVVGKRDHFMLAVCGHTEELALMIAKRENLVEDRDEQRRTLLYIASRSGFYDTCKLLLQKGASVNETQRDGSTPLHGAAYFGHALVAGLLLQYGARSDVKNKWGTALEESATPEIRSLIQTASADYISSLAAKLREN